jgi:hypothetical protein
MYSIDHMKYKKQEMMREAERRHLVQQARAGNSSAYRRPSGSTLLGLQLTRLRAWLTRSPRWPVPTPQPECTACGAGA